MMRNAQWAALHSSMSMGQGPWTFGDKQVETVMLAAAQLHDRLQPYIYSQALRWYQDGYPWTMAPLPVAFPGDPQVYGRENERVRGYEWMIGDALLAAPLYGNDFETATARDIYLPAGTWFDYDTGERYQGSQVLKSFALPAGKTPLFVGGSGIVIEKKGAALVARVYPVGSEAKSQFLHTDGSISTIDVHVTDWKKAVIHTSAGVPVAGDWQRHALEFAIQPGVNYQLR
jgi:alpha-glucosidase (family GH31 glycosyl hydrolase)